MKTVIKICQRNIFSYCYPNNLPYFTIFSRGSVKFLRQRGTEMTICQNVNVINIWWLFVGKSTPQHAKESTLAPLENVQKAAPPCWYYNYIHTESFWVTCYIMMLRHRPSDRVQGHGPFYRTYCMTKWYIFRAEPKKSWYVMINYHSKLDVLLTSKLKAWWPQQRRSANTSC